MSSTTVAARRRPRALLAACAVAALVAAVVPGTGRPAAAAGPVRIMPIGDSITEGSDGSVTYRRFLWHLLAAAGHRVDFVGTRSGVRDGVPRYTDFDQDHDGHAGWRADQIVDGFAGRAAEGRLAEWVTSAQPDVVLLHIGTNDTRQCQPAADTATEIREIVAVLRAARPDVAVLLARILPTTAQPERSCVGEMPERVDELNGRIASLAREVTTTASPVLVVDQHTGFDLATDTDDGVHPNEAGDRKMADRWFRALGAVLPPATPPTTAPPPSGAGYWLLDADGRVYAFGDAGHHGNADVGPRSAVDIEATPDGEGYWILDDGGRVHPFGTAPHAGDATGLPPGERTTSLAATVTGRGYWLFTDAGRAMAFGDAVPHGGLVGTALNGPVLDGIRTASGGGYHMVGADGGVFSFGDASFSGSMGGTRLNGRVLSMAPDPDTAGYWLVAEDGGVFAFDAPFRGSMGGRPLNRPVVGMVPYGDGYLMVAADGGIFTFSDQPFLGSLGGNPPPAPVVGVASAGAARS